MCGIAGWYRRDGRPVDLGVIRAQCDTIVHRGPDDQGQWVDGDFGFGMRRLAVVDLAGGHQPMDSHCGRYAIAYNGEIYNAAELRAELEQLGRTFRTRSDTEVALEAFAAWGDACWPRLEGMFAIAVWDRSTRRLRLARDPLGIKPLYWTLQQDGVAFASELRAIGPVPGLTFEVDPVALEQFVTLGAVLTPRSIYRRVHKLAPAHLLTIEATGEPRLARYWRLSLEPREGVIDEDWIAECRTRLLASVERHLIADVPVGAFLSGGVDSAAVVAAISRLGAEPLRTFTIGFDQRRFDETAAAAELAAHLGCEHRIERLDAATAIGLLPQVAATYDEPFADDSALPTWLVSRLARQEVTVALSGDGGDELFAGYRRYRSELQLGRLKRLPGAQTVLARLARLPMPSGRRFARLARLAHDSALERPVERSFAKQYASSTAVLASLWGPSLPPSAVAGYRRWADELFDCGTGKAADADAIRLPDDPLRSLLAVDTQVWLPDDILTKVDRASMAHSLEVRVPLLSHRFVDWTATVPNRLKLDCGVGKQLLRRAVADWLPPGFLDRPKQGFSIPLAAWALGEFGDHALAVWNSSGIADSGWFSSAAMSRLLYEHRRGDADHGAVIFTLLMLAYWWPTRLGAAAAAPPNNCS